VTNKSRRKVVETSVSVFPAARVPIKIREVRDKITGSRLDTTTGRRHLSNPYTLTRTRIDYCQLAQLVNELADVARVRFRRPMISPKPHASVALVTEIAPPDRNGLSKDRVQFPCQPVDFVFEFHGCICFEISGTQ